MAGSLLATAKKAMPTLERGIADGGYQGAATAAEVREMADMAFEIVKNSDGAKGFKVLPKRWIVERTFGWLGRCPRLAKDSENLTRCHAGFCILAMTRLILRRLARCPATR